MSVPRTSEEQFQDPDYEWPYDFRPAPGRSGRVMRDGHEYKVFRDPEEETDVPDPEDVFAGAWPRAWIENHANVDDQPFYVGIDEYAEPVPIEQEQMFRHIIGLGQTGGGKTTFLETVGAQHTWSGNGLCVVDPGGEAVFNIIRQAPADRFDDVVLLDVGADYTDRHVGFNLLDTYHDPGEPGFDVEVENRVSDILPLLNADEYQRMKGVAAHVLRGLIEADYTREDNGESTRFGEAVVDHFGGDEDTASADENYTINDMYHIIGSQSNREAWHEMVVEEELVRLEPYARILADMDEGDNKLEPLIRRLRNWVESETIRPIVSQRKTTISIPEVVREGKILLIKCDKAPDEVRQIVTSAISRMIWSVCMARPSSEQQFLMEEMGAELPEAVDGDEGYEPEPFYLVLDEVHSLLSKNTKMVDMLAEARKKKLGLVLLTQQLNQLPSGRAGNFVQEKIISNTATTVAFHPGDDAKEQSAVASAFRDRSPNDLLVDQFHATMAITDDQGKTAPGFVAEMVPPVPPRRGLDTVVEILKRSLDEYGVETKSAEEDLKTVPDRFTSALAGLDTPNDGGTVLELTDERADQILATTFGVLVDHDFPKGGAPIDPVIERTERQLSVSGQHVDTLIQKANAQELVDVTPDGERIELTPDGREQLWDSGQSGNAGKIGHQAPMEYIARGLSTLGYHVRVPRQTGDEMPDLVAEVPIETGGATLEEAKQNREQLLDDYPGIFALSGEQDVAVEFEKATRSAPAQIGDNLRKGVENGDHVLFVVNADDDGFADGARQISDKLSDPMLTYTNARTPNDADRRYHHCDYKCAASADGDSYIALPGDVTYQWVDDGESAVVLRNSDGDEYARFDSIDDWLDRSPADFPVTYEVSDDGYVDVRGDENTISKTQFREEYTPVSSPHLPREEFQGELPSPDAWDIAVLPDDPDLPLQYYDADDDTCYPLPGLTSSGASKADTEADSSLAIVEEPEDDDDLWSNLV
ncbi:type IV secretory system conjugative DNA transfer family protein [Halobacteria archaeon HArc-gm2]|nr:type IV secretory system conjugative DNA transfer family protein [Halobacteria archaeon HArc-gm2]